MNTFYAIVVSAVLAFCAGFYTKGKFDTADKVEQVVEVRKADAVSVNDAGKRDAKVEAKIEKNASDDKRAKKEITRYVKPRAPQPVASCKEGGSGPAQAGPAEPPARQVVAADDVLPVGAVRVLDGARDGTLDRAAPIGDEEGRAASDVAFEEFAGNDLEVVRLYKDLAARHDELVEFVNDLMRKQRKRLGIKD